MQRDDHLILYCTTPPGEARGTDEKALHGWDWCFIFPTQTSSRKPQGCAAKWDPERNRRYFQSMLRTIKLDYIKSLCPNTTEGVDEEGDEDWYIRVRASSTLIPQTGKSPPELGHALVPLIDIAHAQGKLRRYQRTLKADAQDPSQPLHPWYCGHKGRKFVQGTEENWATWCWNSIGVCGQLLVGADAPEDTSIIGCTFFDRHHFDSFHASTDESMPYFNSGERQRLIKYHIEDNIEEWFQALSVPYTSSPESPSASHAHGPGAELGSTYVRVVKTWHQSDSCSTSVTNFPRVTPSTARLFLGELSRQCLINKAQ